MADFWSFIIPVHYRLYLKSLHVSKLYSNGLIVYNRPTSYTFSCKLNLDDFPFDTQEYTLLFGSWKIPKSNS